MLGHQQAQWLIQGYVYIYICYFIKYLCDFNTTDYYHSKWPMCSYEFSWIPVTHWVLNIWSTKAVECFLSMLFKANSLVLATFHPTSSVSPLTYIILGYSAWIDIIDNTGRGIQEWKTKYTESRSSCIFIQHIEVQMKYNGCHFHTHVHERMYLNFYEEF